MVLKCVLLFLFLFGNINAEFWSSSDNRPCPRPRFDHGRFRMRQKSKLIKFICFPGYYLVGNKYATCRGGQWDVPLPVCVKPGCTMLTVQNGISLQTHGGAWLVFFCYPHLKLVGSPAVYCDGRKWNASAPTCVDTADVSPLTCDFEDSNLCGWTQDELHDFDWKRINKKTPSSFLFTGPSYDHTYGERGNGYYMYIESTSRLENETARLISPLYDKNLAKNGCFQFFYHMFGKTIGGLRVYQKPETLSLPNLLQMSESGHKDNYTQYLLFEKWGNQGDTWYTGVATLTDFEEDFQIIIEGIRGTSYTSDIAIDDISILQGDSCVTAKNAATTPAVVLPDSCVGRCNVYGVPSTDLSCGCTAECVTDSNCCPDFFDICVFESSTTEEISPVELPQTQKLVASNTPSTTVAFPSTSKAPVTVTTPQPTVTPETTTPKPSTTTKPPTTVRKPSSTTPKPTTKTVKTTAKIISTTRKIPTLVFETSTHVYNKTGQIHKDSSTQKSVVDTTVKPTTKLILKTTLSHEEATKQKTIVMSTTKSAKQSYVEDKKKSNKEQKIESKLEAKKLGTQTKKGESSGKASVLIIAGLLCCIAAVWLAVWSRGERGRAALARLRGRVRNDPDVQYLHSSVDDED